MKSLVLASHKHLITVQSFTLSSSNIYLHYFSFSKLFLSRTLNICTQSLYLLSQASGALETEFVAELCEHTADLFACGYPKGLTKAPRSSLMYLFRRGVENCKVKVAFFEGIAEMALPRNCLCVFITACHLSF